MDRRELVDHGAEDGRVVRVRVDDRLGFDSLVDREVQRQLGRGARTWSFVSRDHGSAEVDLDAVMRLHHVQLDAPAADQDAVPVSEADVAGRRDHEP